MIRVSIESAFDGNRFPLFTHDDAAERHGTSSRSSSHAPFSISPRYTSSPFPQPKTANEHTQGSSPGASPPRLKSKQADPYRVHSLTGVAMKEPGSGSEAGKGLDPRDPLGMVHREVETVSERIRLSVVTEIPALSHAAEYFLKFGAEGKRFRPSLLLLLATALSPAPLPPERFVVDERHSAIYVQEERRRQQRLAEIAELMHVTSLLHDDVIDNADTRRGMSSLNAEVGNKLAILAGDFLLARASVTLAALRNPEVIMLMAQILENLVGGEIMQMTSSDEELMGMENYLKKTFKKTASLMANSSKAITILGGHSAEVCDRAFHFGRHLGMAFQIVDDVLDFTSTSGMLGKPTLNDLNSGISTAPVLFAMKEFPELQPLIIRKFKQEGDVSKAVELVQKSAGIQKANELAMEHAGGAKEMVRQFPAPLHQEAELAREALFHLTDLVLNRKK